MKADRALRLCWGAAAALSVACTPTSRIAQDRPDVDPKIVAQVMSSAAAQIQHCYRAPRVSHLGKQITTRVAVRLNADGTLAGLPSILFQTGVTEKNRSEAERMAEAANLAIIRCAPLHLPPEHYTLIWERFELTFSPRAVV
jgi:hypothetical protein